MGFYNFVGSPASGKTTTAALLFAGMKESSMPCELSLEQARFYIAKKRVELNLAPKDSFPALKDEEQYEIMQLQVNHDEILSKSCGKEITIISDSSPLNSMLYMSEDFRNQKQVQDLALRSLQYTTACFYSEPIYSPYETDPNRIHTLEQSIEINKKIPHLLNQFPSLKVFSLHGKTIERLLIAQTKVFF